MKYRKKPVEVDAFYYDGDGVEVMNWISTFLNHGEENPAFIRLGEGLIIKTLEGEHLASVGDWIIRGVVGEFYPCKPDVFAKTYERIGMQHIESKDCWCDPVMYYKDEETGVECWSHNEAGKQ